MPERPARGTPMHITTTFGLSARLALCCTFAAAVHAAHAQSWSVTHVFGQVDAQETNYNEVVPNRLFHPAGVLVDQMPAPTPSRVYIWDSGNNRILGFDHAGSCTAGPAALLGKACTENSGCGQGGHCSAEKRVGTPVVIGQPSGFDAGACNGDNTTIAPPTARSLCAIPYPYQISPLEGPRGNQMAVDSAHNLYAVDLQNNRLLRYPDPMRAGNA